MEEMKQQIVNKWIQQMRDALSKMHIQHSSIPDAEIENFYNFYLSFK